ncbi:hypothetical protein NCG89_03815 [Spongiibacter taiwanensis]|uniref:hypothetical protein n=1 Tax=Spongiibacter taiwanensis TaxID=1748242 RepID=UPI0020359B7F|nr:hypothetical protein [Spongiibacter taiwanensis]USA43918.1 hypothetical protein NCG89_03815 [Spongiibacter taiwanensis]
MSVSDWTPASSRAELEIDREWLQKCLAISQQDALEALPTRLSADEIRDKANYMQLSLEQWQSAVTDFSNEDLVALIRFFTRAEMLLPGWEAGKTSPVIALNKVLRLRGERLSRETLIWIRQNSDNRFIPNGGL